MKSPILISIFAESAAGKSTLSKKLVEALGGFDVANRVPVDYYLKSNTFGDMLDYYQDDRVDWEFLEKDLNNPIGTKIFLPDYDFNKLQRREGRLEKFFSVKEINILDALYPYKKANLKVFLKIDDDTRKQRMLSRHHNERKGADKVTIDFMFENWDKLPWLENWLSEKNIIPDITLYAQDPIEDNVHKIVDLLTFSPKSSH